jgi:hypothetical protein
VDWERCAQDGKNTAFNQVRVIELQDLKGRGFSRAVQIAPGSWASAPEVRLCHSFIRPD